TAAVRPLEPAHVERQRHDDAAEQVELGVGLQIARPAQGSLVGDAELAGLVDEAAAVFRMAADEGDARGAGGEAEAEALSAGLVEAEVPLNGHGAQRTPEAKGSSRTGFPGPRA